MILGNNIINQIAFDLADHILEPQFALLELLHLEQVDGFAAVHHAVNHVIKRLVLASVFCKFESELFLIFHVRKVVQVSKP